MINNKNFVTKLSSFYVSDWHLITMLIPYINKNINEEVKIITILEENLFNNIETLINKLNLKNKEKIRELDWKKIKPLSYAVIKQKIEERNNGKQYDKIKKDEICFIVNGTEEYIENANNIIEKCLKQREENKIKIVNCYDITKVKQNINMILDRTDKILNTSGEREISDIYEEYKKING